MKNLLKQIEQISTTEGAMAFGENDKEFSVEDYLGLIRKLSGEAMKNFSFDLAFKSQLTREALIAKTGVYWIYKLESESFEVLEILR